MAAVGVAVFSAKPQEKENKKIERKVHHDETKGFRDMGGLSALIAIACSAFAGGDILSLREAARSHNSRRTSCFAFLTREAMPRE